MEIEQKIAIRAFIINNGKVLIIRESNQYEGGTQKGNWDLVGGKVKPGEKIEEAINREVFEETKLKITIGKPFATSEWRPVIKGKQAQIIAIFFLCELAEPKEIYLSKDHDTYLWIDPKEYKETGVIPTLYRVFEEYIKMI